MTEEEVSTMETSTVEEGKVDYDGKDFRVNKMS